MKKSWMQILSLALSVVLLIIVVAQWTVLNGLRTELADSRQELDALTERLNGAETVMETMQAAQSEEAPAVHFANVSVDTGDRMMTVDIIAELPGKAEGYAYIGLCMPGEAYRSAWSLCYLQRQADGTYAGSVTFPVDLDMDIELRLEDDTVLYSGPVTALLPVQLKSGGASWHYNSTLEKFYLLDCVPVLTDPQGRETQVTGGVCRVYRNGEPVVEDQYFREPAEGGEDGDTEEGFIVPCAPGDHIRLCCVCTDEFGLRYEFPMGEWAAQRWDDAVACPLSSLPAVTWPE